MNPGWPTILHVEDDLGDKELFQHASNAAKIKWNIQWAEDGLLAVDYLSGAGTFSDRNIFALPGLVLLDLKLPRKTGLEVLEWARKQQPLKWLPIVIFTASNSPSDLRRSFELGANSVIVKPTAYRDLISYTKDLHHYWFELNRSPGP